MDQAAVHEQLLPRDVAGTWREQEEDGVSDVTHPIGSWFDSQFHAGSYKSRNDALKRQIAELQGQLHMTALQREELAQYQKLYKIAGPWWWLENLVFQQAWEVTNGTTSSLTLAMKNFGM